MSLFVHRTESGRCPVCGVPGAACGTSSDTVPVDAHIMEVAAVGGPLRKYRYTSGSGHETVLKLSDRDAARLKLTEDDLLDDAPPPDPEPAVKAQPVAANKARGSSTNKAASTGRRARKTASTAGGTAEQVAPDLVVADPGDDGQSSADSGATGDSGNGGSGGGD